MSKMNLTPINKRKRVMGWVAVALSLAVASFFGMFAGAEGVTEGWPAVLGHSAQMLVVIVPALSALLAGPGGRWGPGEPLPVQRVSPEAEAVTVTAGQSLTFTAAAQDPDGDLRTLEWWVTKMNIGKQVDLAGGQARESFEVTFPDAGRFDVQALFTAASGRDGSTFWSVTVKSP